jgi:tetratricopeptide (TPR) repeat protein
LLALAYLTVNAGEAAAAEIDAVARLSPGAADVQLAWASWYAAQRDYASAAAAYQQAVLLAAPVERGRYALLGAQFYLTTTYALCDEGLPLAEAAAQALPADGAALTTLAATYYACAQFAAAAEAARAAQAAGAGAGADAAYYLGAALAALGETPAARRQLIRAADLAPASIWRERAETMLAYLPE